MQEEVKEDSGYSSHSSSTKCLSITEVTEPHNTSLHETCTRLNSLELASTSSSTDIDTDSNREVNGLESEISEQVPLFGFKRMSIAPDNISSVSFLNQDGGKYFSLSKTECQLRTFKVVSPDKPHNINEENVESISNAEIIKRLHCENTIKELQGIILKSNQENAILNVKCYELEQDLLKNNEILSKLKKKSVELAAAKSNLDASSQLLEAEISKTKRELKELKVNLENSTDEKTNLEHEIQKCNRNQAKMMSDLSKEIESLKGNLDTAVSKGEQNKETIKALEEELASVRKELIEVATSKLEDLSIHESEIKKFSKTLIEEQELRSNGDCRLKELEEKIQILQNERDNLTEELKRTIHKKEDMENEFRKSESQKVVQEVEHSAILKKSVYNVEKQFEDKMSTLLSQKNFEIERLRNESRAEIDRLKMKFSETIRKFEEKFKNVKLEKVQSQENLSQRLKNSQSKVEQMKASRSKLLSKFQECLQKQWSETVQLLYSPDEESESEDENTTESISSEDEELKDLNDHLLVNVHRDNINKEASILSGTLLDFHKECEDGDATIQRMSHLENTRLLNYRSDKLKSYINMLLESNVECESSTERDDMTEIPERDQ